MNWKNLKNYKCPDCGTTLFLNSYSQTHSCTHCNFRIADEKFKEIIRDQYRPRKIKSEENRFSELNNLGRPEVAEDFSDSPALDK